MKKLRPLFPKEMDEVWALYNADPSLRQILEAHLRDLAARNLGISYGSPRLLLEPPPSGKVDGDFRLGEVIYAGETMGPFGLSRDELLQHTAIFGRSGAGKTNCALSICKHLLSRAIPFLVLDWKRTYREMLQWPEAAGLRVLTAGRETAPFRFNPIASPPGCDAGNWAKQLADIICGAYDLGEGAASLLHRGLLELVDRPGAGWADLVRWLGELRSKGREVQWLASARRAALGLSSGSIGRVLSPGGEGGLVELLARPTVIELDALSDTEKVFLVGAVLRWIHQYRMGDGGREVLKHVIVLEEAHHVLGRGGREGMPELLMREIRELGEAVVLLDQHPSLVSLPSLGNTYCTIAMNQKHSRDVGAVGQALLLAETDRELLGRIPVGQAVVKLQDRWTRPFLVRLNAAGLRKGMVDDRWVGRQSAGDSADSGQLRTPNDPPKEIPVLPAADTLSPKERMLLEDVAGFPFVHLTSRMERTELSARAAAEAAGKLAARGLVEGGLIKTPAGRERILRLTPPGRRAAEQAGLKVSEPPARGGIEHEFWKHRVAELLRDGGFAVEAEVRLHGHSGDLVASKEGRRYILEIETGASEWRSNIERCLREDSFDGLVVVVTSKAAFGKLRRMIGEQWPRGVAVVWVGKLGTLPETLAGMRQTRQSATTG